MHDDLDRLLRREAAGAFAAVYARFRDYDLAEEARQEAMIAAWQSWRARGVPDSPGAWLTVVARRKAVDILRRRRAAGRSVDAAAADSSAWGGGESRLDARLDPLERNATLKLLFLCCHPAIRADAQIALMLKEVCGLSASQIASLLLLEEMAVYQRLSRAKRKIRSSGIPLRLPDPPELCSRILLVLESIYLLFTEGYVRSDGDGLFNEALCDEAIYLGQRVVALLHELDGSGTCRELGIAESLGLLSLMRLHHARRKGRRGEDEGLVLLDAQDRSRWDREQIEEATALLDRAIALRHPGPYQTEAAIAALHCAVDSPQETDWRQIRLLYDRLLEWKPTAVVALNRAVAVGMSDGPAAGLEAARAAGRDGRLSDYAPYHVALAELAHRAGDPEVARLSWERALQCTKNAAERRYLASRLAALG